MRLVNEDEGIEALVFLIETLRGRREPIEEPLDDQRLNFVVPEETLSLLFREINHKNRSIRLVHVKKPLERTVDTSRVFAILSEEFGHRSQ